MFDLKEVTVQDADVAQAIEDELKRQKEHIELIASEQRDRKSVV